MDEPQHLEEELAWLEVEKGEYSQEYRDLAQQYWSLMAQTEAEEAAAWGYRAWEMDPVAE